MLNPKLTKGHKLLAPQKGRKPVSFEHVSLNIQTGNARDNIKCLPLRIQVLVKRSGATDPAAFL
jgi:hypothetical protein